MSYASKTSISGQQNSALARLLAKYVVDRADDDAGFLAGEIVIDRLAVAPRRHQAIRAQPRQLLRDGRLAQAEDVFQFTDRLFTLGENAKDHQPVFVRQRLEEIAGAFGVVHHALELVRTAAAFELQFHWYTNDPKFER